MKYFHQKHRRSQSRDCESFVRPLTRAGLLSVCDSASCGHELQMRLCPWGSIRIHSNNTVTIMHNCFPCHSLSFVSDLLYALDKSSNSLVWAQACREKHSSFAHAHKRKEIFLTFFVSSAVVVTTGLLFSFFLCSNDGQMDVPLEAHVGSLLVTTSRKLM